MHGAEQPAEKHLAGWKIGEGYLQKTPTEAISTDKNDVEARFAALVDQLKKNNPIVLFTRLSVSKSHGHIIVISGFKRVSGELCGKGNGDEKGEAEQSHFFPGVVWLIVRKPSASESVPGSTSAR